ALQRLRIPTLLFVNKTDRMGADVERVVTELRSRIAPNAVPCWAIDVAMLAERDEALLAAYVEGVEPSRADLSRAFSEQARLGLLHPVLAGSALTGEGFYALMEAIP